MAKYSPVAKAASIVAVAFVSSCQPRPNSDDSIPLGFEDGGVLTTCLGESVCWYDEEMVNPNTLQRKLTYDLGWYDPEVEDDVWTVRRCESAEHGVLIAVDETFEAHWAVQDTTVFNAEGAVYATAYQSDQPDFCDQTRFRRWTGPVVCDCEWVELEWGTPVP